MMGVAYIKAWARKPVIWLKSLYFAVSTDIHRPIPRPREATKGISKGRINIAQVISKVEDVGIKNL